MIKLYDFGNFVSNGRTYGGKAGSKKGILIDGKDWFLKYPKSTKSMENVGVSYTSAPLSEYIGSHIYQEIGIDVHETLLGIDGEKVVVACKDFTKNNEILVDYNSIKNNPDMMIQEILDSLISESDLLEIERVMDDNIYFNKINGLKERFWDMFVVDAFINNNDRNSGNWGIILNRDTYEYRIAPVYDNGASFYNKSEESKMARILENDFKMKQSFLDSAISVFTIADKPINPLLFIRDCAGLDLRSAMLRVIPNINMEKIYKLIDDIPNNYEGVSVMSDIQKEFYKKSLKYKYENILLPAYEKIKTLD